MLNLLKYFIFIENKKYEFYYKENNLKTKNLFSNNNNVNK